jgi:ADP-heptose:LPS heptosyltransferase
MSKEYTWRDYGELYAQLRAEARRIAVVRALYLGDFLVATPAVWSLRHAFPDAELSFIGLPWMDGLVQRLGVDRFLPFPGYPGIPEVPYTERETARFLAQHAGELDLVVQLHGNGSIINGFVGALGARHSLGYTIGGTPSTALTLPIRYPGDGLHQVPKWLRLVERIGVKPLGNHLVWPVTDADQRELERLAPGLNVATGPLVGLHPGAKAPARRWPPARFAAVADRLQQEVGATVVLLGGPDERPIAERVLAAMCGTAVDLVGRTSVAVLGALVARLDLLVADDSGPAHLAAALDTPSVQLWGPGDPPSWGPLDQLRHRVLSVDAACSPCGFAECPIDHRCMLGIEVDEVLAAARAQLAHSSL